MKNNKKLIVSALVVSGIFGVVFLVLLVFSNLDILQERSFIFFPADVPSTTIGLVFGGGLNKDGSLNSMVEDRIAAGVALFRSGKVGKLMITGDDGRMYNNEVDAMKKAVLALGVAEDKILVDRHGYRTYDSCYREAKVYGIKRVVAVSQFFHLPRIIFLCEHFGIGTTGVAADFRNYGFDSLYMNIREIGARLKSWWQVNVTNPKPLVSSK